MEKAYSRINWKNGSRSTDTPLNETNMNLMDSAIDVIDGRVCQHDAQIQTLQGYETRAAQSAAEALQSAQDAEDSATDSANSASASSQSANASALSASSASASATQSQSYSRDSEAWAVGTRNGTAVPSTDETYENNSKYYAEQAQHIVDDFTPTFTQASTRANINSGETISTIMGKIKKFFADLKTVAFTGNASDVSYTNTTSGLSATNVQGAIDESLAENETAISSAAAWMVYENNKSPVRKYFVVSTNSADKWTYRGRGTTGRGNTDKVVVFVQAAGQASQTGFMICAIGTSESAVTWANPTSNGDAIVNSFKTKRGNTLYIGTNSGTFTKEYNTYGNATIDGVTYNLIPIANSSPNTESVRPASYRNAISRIAEDILVYDMAYTHLTQNTGEYAIANDEPTTTSSQAYSVGQYLTQGGRLKKVTSAIASGESITGNNTSNTTVGAELTKINSDLSELSQRPFVAYNTAISVGSTATIPYNLSKYREIGLEFQGSNINAPYWIIIPTTSATIQVGNVVGINNLSSQCGITFGSVTINPSTNSVTNVRMSLLYYTGSNWALSDNNRTILRVWLRK